MFSIAEIIDLAIQMEYNGEKVYRDALGQITNPSLAWLLQWLADEEKAHADWFRQLKETIGPVPMDPELEEMGRKLFMEVLGDQTFSLADADFGNLYQINELIELAVGFEQDTILFYEMLGQVIEDEETTAHLETIVSEEKRHVDLLNEFLRTGDLRSVRNGRDIP